jgi:hypothetical protein
MLDTVHCPRYSGRKITDSLVNVTVRGGKRWKGQGGSAMANSLSMYSITENIYYPQLSSVAILLQPEPNCFTSYNTRKGFSFLSPCAIALQSSPPSHVSTCNGQRSSQLFRVHYTFDRYDIFKTFLYFGPQTSGYLSDIF